MLDLQNIPCIVPPNRLFSPGIYTQVESIKVYITYVLFNGKKVCSQYDDDGVKTVGKKSVSPLDSGKMWLYNLYRF